MSFTGEGPLGRHGWGTTTSQALQQQQTDIYNKYKEFELSLNNNSISFHPPQQFPSLSFEHNAVLSFSYDVNDVWPAAVFTDNEKENWSEDKRKELASKKKDYSDQPKEFVEAEEKYRHDNLESLKRRHDAIEGLEKNKRNVIFKAAHWIASVVVNLRLREILLYPLIRDQLPNGVAYFKHALLRNDQVRTKLRHIRHIIYENADDVSFYEIVKDVQGDWKKGWEEDVAGGWIEKLTEYLKHVQLSNLRDIVASQGNIKDPEPPTSHDLNIGQQLVQMYHIQYLYLVKTGNLQGIPRPRHCPDWSCTDGFEPAHPLMYGPPPHEIGQPPKPTGHAVGTPIEEEIFDQTLAKELPPLDKPVDSNRLLVGTGLGSIIPSPDARSPEARKKFTEQNLKREKETVEAIQKAKIAYYGSDEKVKAAVKEHIIKNAAEKATSLIEYLEQKPHSTDLEGSYYFNEVQLAFRNHGTHWESLVNDITPLGEHYLLIHYDVQYYRNLDDYRLKVYGCVKNPVELTIDQVKEMAKGVTYTMPMIMECSGNGRAMMKPRYNQHVPWGLQAFGCYCWTGTPLRTLIDRLGVTSDCVDVVFTGYDAGLEKEKELRYFSHSLNIHNPVLDYTWLVWMNNGVNLLPEHGYPLRIMTPAWYGNVNIKWLKSINFLDRKFKGAYQRTYSYTRTPTDNDIAVPSQELRPRAMLKPVGFPDFTTRKRTALAGPHAFSGKCWVGGGHYRTIIAVEISLDGGSTWLLAHLEPRIGVFAWANFSLTVDLPVGLYTVVVRATDNVGQRQKVQLDDWNFASMQDDAVQVQELTVVDGLSFME